MQLRQILILEEEKLKQINQHEKTKTALNDEIDKWSAGFRNFQELNHVIDKWFASIESRQNSLNSSLQEVARSIDRMKQKLKEEKLFGLMVGVMASSLVWLLAIKLF